MPGHNQLLRHHLGGLSLLLWIHAMEHFSWVEDRSNGVTRNVWTDLLHEIEGLDYKKIKRKRLFLALLSQMLMMEVFHPTPENILEISIVIWSKLWKILRIYLLRLRQLSLLWLTAGEQFSMPLINIFHCLSSQNFWHGLFFIEFLLKLPLASHHFLNFVFLLLDEFRSTVLLLFDRDCLIILNNDFLDTSFLECWK